MKSVLISIQPKNCHYITIGRQTIIVNKTKPKLTAPFKCYIYQTKSKDNAIYKQYKVNDIRSGKVIGEFICDRIDKYSANRLGWYKYPIEETCLWNNEIAYYGKGKSLYGWYISNLVIYDKPKELSEFKNTKGEPITRAFQSWCYVEEV